MKIYRRLLVVSVIFLLLVAIIPTQTTAKTENKKDQTSVSTNGITYEITSDDSQIVSTSKADLIAGGGNPKGAKRVGYVNVWNDGTYLYVQYQIEDPTPSTDLTDDWYITETHLEVATSLDGIPQKNGNPVPGQFTYKNTHDYVTSYTYKIPLSKFNDGRTLYIAAHANVVVPNGLKGLELSLPDTVNLVILNARTGSPSYLDPAFVMNGGNLNGNYMGWCVDRSHNIAPCIMFNAKVYSSYESIPAGVIYNPSNLKKVNWILNNIKAGQMAPDGTVYTYGDIQKAIWSLVAISDVSNSVGKWSQAHVNMIVSAANYNGANFVPGPGQNAAVVLVPCNAKGQIVAQVIIITVTVPSYTSSETAWGGIMTSNGLSTPFPGKNWATYFNYRIG